jgi:hypothetical protein
VFGDVLLSAVGVQTARTERPCCQLSGWRRHGCRFPLFRRHRTRSGVDKTTTIRILSTLLAPDAGLATVFGHDVVAEPEAVRAAIGVTGQFSAVDKFLTGRENPGGQSRHCGRGLVCRHRSGRIPVGGEVV